MPKTNFLALVRDARLAELETRYDDATSVLTISRDAESQLSTDLSQPAGRAALETFFGTFLSDDISGPPTLLKADGHSFSDL
ncbi:MAG: MOSC domain-containing protein, partial [Alphaproteobacteria bacterium]|nr:MOSC domain-containing protein [Alphaproteobacteria bacterium]